MSENVQELQKIELIDTEQTLGVITKAEIDMRISTARAYPRNREAAINEAIEMATYDEETASACIYALPRDGKTIKGASIRLAEIMAYCWGNIHAATRIIGNDGTFVTAQGVAWDLEKNDHQSAEVKRSIKTKYGKTYSLDMQATTANAAASIALRNAIFRVIPGYAWKRVYDACEKRLLGETKDINTQRKTVFQRLNKLGLTTDKILGYFDAVKIEDINAEQLRELIGIGTAIKDGELAVENAFTGVLEELPQSADDLNKQIFSG